MQINAGFDYCSRTKYWKKCLLKGAFALWNIIKISHWPRDFYELLAGVNIRAIIVAFTMTSPSPISHKLNKLIMLDGVKYRRQWAERQTMDSLIVPTRKSYQWLYTADWLSAKYWNEKACAFSLLTNCFARPDRKQRPQVNIVQVKVDFICY